jgi:hypothetical protein
LSEARIVEIDCSGSLETKNQVNFCIEKFWGKLLPSHFFDGLQTLFPSQKKSSLQLVNSFGTQWS